MEAYPEIDAVANKVKHMWQVGYRVVEAFVLPENCWREILTALKSLSLLQ